MNTRYMPSEEYRRKLKERHILEWICLLIAAAAIVLSVIFLLDINRGLWIPETIVILGGIMNIALSLRAVLVKMWPLAAGLFAAGCVCFGLLAYLSLT